MWGNWAWTVRWSGTGCRNGRTWGTRCLLEHLETSQRSSGRSGSGWKFWRLRGDSYLQWSSEWFSQCYKHFPRLKRLKRLKPRFFSILKRELNDLHDCCVEAVWLKKSHPNVSQSAKEFPLNSIKVELLPIDISVQDLSVKVTDKLQLKHLSYSGGMLFDVCNSQNWAP